jgi:hypothetical protein
MAIRKRFNPHCYAAQASSRGSGRFGRAACRSCRMLAASWWRRPATGRGGSSCCSPPTARMHENWAPTGTETDFTLSPILSPLDALQGSDDRARRLSTCRAMAPATATRRAWASCGPATPCSRAREFAGGDGSSAGWGGGISIDQHIASTVGTETPYTSLEFGVQTGGASVWSRMCYAGGNQPLAPEDDPQAMFDRLFADYDVDASELDRLKAQRQSVIDLVKGDLDSLMARHGSANDRLKIEAHLESIRAIEMRNQAEVPACEVPAAPGGGIDAQANDNFPLVSNLQSDLLTMALTCGLTRVASLQWSASVSGTRFTWAGVPDGHHDCRHLGDDDQSMIDKLTTINTWYAEQVRYLMDALAAVPEGDGTVLDNTLILWGNELSRGNSHGNMPVPFVLLGGGGGAAPDGPVPPVRHRAAQPAAGEPVPRHGHGRAADVREHGYRVRRAGGADVGAGPGRAASARGEEVTRAARERRPSSRLGRGLRARYAAREGSRPPPRRCSSPCASSISRASSTRRSRSRRSRSSWGRTRRGKSNVLDALRFLHGTHYDLRLAEVLDGEEGRAPDAWRGIRGGAREAARFGTESFAIHSKWEAAFEGVYGEDVDVVAGWHEIRCEVKPSVRLLDEGLVDLEGNEVFRVRRAPSGKLEVVTGPKPKRSTDLDNGKSVLHWKEEDSPFMPFLSGINIDVWPAVSMSRIHFIDIQPERMRELSHSGPPLRDDGANLSAVLHALTRNPEARKTFIEWVPSYAPRSSQILTSSRSPSLAM